MEPRDCSINYLAGFFDGEGCISMRERSDGRIPRLTIFITACYLPLLQEYQARFGGSVCATKRYINKPLYQWYLGQLDQALVFLQTIHPYCIEKASQVTCAIRWLEHRSTLRRKGGPVGGVNVDMQLATNTLHELRQAKQHSVTQPYAGSNGADL